MKVQVYEARPHCWRWRAVAENGRIVADGWEAFDSRAHVEHAIVQVAEMFQDGYQVERLDELEDGP